MDNLKPPIEYLHQHRQNFLDQLIELLAFKSISADPSYQDQMIATARWLLEHCRSIGLDCQLFNPTGPAPILLASKIVDPALPTLLIYGHYDVQPPGGPDKWQSNPFEPVLTQKKIVARGSADNKGQFMVYLKALEAYLATHTNLPINVKILLEGQEETASDQLPQFVASNRDLLACNHIVISDSHQFGPDQPAITYGTRGIVYKQIIISGAKNDLHSGIFGGIVPNPCNIIAYIIDQLKSPTGAINIDGFYDNVLPVAHAERKYINALPYDALQSANRLGLNKLSCEQSYTPLECMWIRPTLDVNGIWGGYSGPGSKTVIAAQAGAKISMRLVPDQNAQEISDRFDQMVQKLCPDTVKLEISTTGLADPYLAPRDGPAIKFASAAVNKAFGIAPVLVREGGTLPILPIFRHELGCHCLLIGLAMPDCNAHGPNEYFRLADFYRGMEMAVYLLAELAQAGK